MPRKKIKTKTKLEEAAELSKSVIAEEEENKHDLAPIAWVLSLWVPGHYLPIFIMLAHALEGCRYFELKDVDEVLNERYPPPE